MTRPARPAPRAATAVQPRDVQPTPGGAAARSIAIEPARTDDVGAIVALQRDAYRIEAARYGVPDLPPQTETVDALRVLVATHTVLVARLQPEGRAAPGRVVGSVRAHVTDGTAHIARLAVASGLHGHGIGRQLLAAIESAVGPVARYALFTGHRSDRNLRLYERAGYRPTRIEQWLVHLEKPAADATRR